MSARFCVVPDKGGGCSSFPATSLRREHISPEPSAHYVSRSSQPGFQTARSHYMSLINNSFRLKCPQNSTVSLSAKPSFIQNLAPLGLIPIQRTCRRYPQSEQHPSPHSCACFSNKLTECGPAQDATVWPKLVHSPEGESQRPGRPSNLPGSPQHDGRGPGTPYSLQSPRPSLKDDVYVQVVIETTSDFAEQYVSATDNQEPHSPLSFSLE